MTIGAQVKGCYSAIKSVEASLQILTAKTNEQEQQAKLKEVERIITEVKKDLRQQVIRLSKEEPQYK
ncbi:hypothetical protein J32TS6_08260 [Virgibacillus pantothenticus]|uniref:DUF1657 domain-containing protein n=1 Tax=Virgibacillus pantothenticus TaxID=1473 RepID=A0A0L0QP39_VIRPA|nr:MULTISPECIES: hypothetical protein [Virgibacillus]API93714.1 hypothetical protein BKP57_19010 [Virgibacillus sp. 6R]KNE20003.1 hypothetical protein AFK71_16525 [Virgibacillus pantothenticus]MBS7429877.1 hypothetical protein [Virgibacillus sp. 19R1-5]MBU8565028.1 hypothetical protein [Virgibacillus pantothenticus]MBU8599335.1 hypothetical protein [Virgibacillus pantothenticus]